MNLHENIKRVLREEVNKKYPKPSENLIKSVYNWLNLYFDNSKIYEDGDSTDRGFYFEFCKNGRAISYLRIRLDDRSPDWGPRDRRPSSERSVDEVSLYIYPIMVDMMQKVFPMRKNYIMYLIEEWFEDTYLYKIQQMVNRNDLSLDYIAEFSNKKGELCVPPITKPEDTETQEMMDFIKKNTFFSYNQMEEYEEDEPGWIERMYLGIIRNKERERINREDRENNPDPIDYDGY